jgi:hypothetical protein
MAEAGEWSSYITAFGGWLAVFLAWVRDAPRVAARNPRVVTGSLSSAPTLTHKREVCSKGNQPAKPLSFPKKSRNCAHQPNPLDQTQ